MKNITIIILLLTALASCKKSTLDPIQFDVSADQLTVKVGTPVTFNFTGNPADIVFYSGEPGKEYQFKDRSTVDGGVALLKFNSLEQFGRSTNTMAVLISTDFKPDVYDTTSVKSATWTDITNRLILNTGGASSTPSGNVDISDFLALGKPIFLAFKYTNPLDPGFAQRTWTITNLSVTYTLPSGKVLTQIDNSTAGFVSVDFANFLSTWKVTSSNINISGETNPPASSLDWVISKPVILNKVTKDAGVSIKNLTLPLIPYQYIFNTPGTYTVSFDAYNSGSDGNTNNILKQLTITVTP